MLEEMRQEEPEVYRIIDDITAGNVDFAGRDGTPLDTISIFSQVVVSQRFESPIALPGGCIMFTSRAERLPTPQQQTMESEMATMNGRSGGQGQGALTTSTSVWACPPESSTLFDLVSDCPVPVEQCKRLHLQTICKSGETRNGHRQGC